jgi:RNA polymerase primary sigma factor
MTKTTIEDTAEHRSAPLEPLALHDEEDPSTEDVPPTALDQLEEPDLSALPDVESIEDLETLMQALDADNHRTQSDLADERGSIGRGLSLGDDDDRVVDSDEDDDDVFAMLPGTTYRDALAYHVGKNLQHALLTKEEEQLLGRQIAAGSEAAFLKMFQANLRLVVSIARRYQSRCQSGLSLEDLIAEGNMGLMIAVRRFDPEMGYRFTTYASYWIRQSIVRQVEDQSRPVRVPLAIAQLYTRYAKLKAKATNEGRALKDDEVMICLEISKEHLERLKEMSLYAVSMDTPLDQDGEKASTLIDTMFDEADTVDERVAIQDQQQKLLTELMSRHLNKREQKVLRNRFGFDGNEDTLKGIADQYDLSRERIRQVETVALRKLRHALSINGIWADVLLD